MDAHLLFSAALIANIVALAVVVGKLRNDMRDHRQAQRNRGAATNWTSASLRRDMPFFVGTRIGNARKG